MEQQYHDLHALLREDMAAWRFFTGLPAPVRERLSEGADRPHSISGLYAKAEQME